MRARIDDLAQLVTDSTAQLEQHGDRLTGATAAARHAGGDLDGTVRTHHQGLQEARRLVGADLTRRQQHIEQTRDPGPEPLGGCACYQPAPRGCWTRLRAEIRRLEDGAGPESRSGYDQLTCSSRRLPVQGLMSCADDSESVRWRR